VSGSAGAPPIFQSGGTGTNSMSARRQRTIRRPAVVRAVGFFTAADVTLRMLPAPAGHGIAFQRVDCPGTRPIPATIEFALPRERRTALGRDGVAVETVEHVLAALAGLQIDNCLIEIDGPEVPGCDGSARDFVDAILETGAEEQNELRTTVEVTAPFSVTADDGRSQIHVRPSPRDALVLEYTLDYGPQSPIAWQELRLEITPDSFVRELALARTFVLESEVAALRAAGYGQRTTSRDLLVFATDGSVIGNSLRYVDECVRHKLLDCLGDFSLLGCDLSGRFAATRSGHRLNREVIRRLISAHSQTSIDTNRPEAA
jgi:UDP-3-O-[3-hydroxymyristoyl] N-acetylglucosamine deacetylase